jgi:leucyl/phenylalanyl-tRNA--protein transferase
MKHSFHVAILGSRTPFPDPREATADGLVAMGGDLGPNRLLEAYRHGIFPWSAEPVTWWSPDPRAIFELEAIHVPRRLERTLRQRRFLVTYDCAFREVIRACAAPAPGRENTWLEPALQRAYIKLHQLGHAHSVECWRDGELVGGVYGVALGGFFAGESMFHCVTDASKVALVHLLRHLRERGFRLFDTQVATAHTRRLGAVDIPRRDYLKRLEQALEVEARFDPA